MEKVSNKEFHIFSVGNSLCSHYENSLVEKEKKDEEFWKHVYEDRNELKKILDFLRSDPETYSAEVQAFSCYKKANESKLSGTSSYELYFVITDTYSNRVVGKVLEIFLKKKGIKWMFRLKRMFSGKISLPVMFCLILFNVCSKKLTKSEMKDTGF